MRLIRFVLSLALCIVVLDYVRDNIPGWRDVLKPPLPRLPTEIADMLGDRAKDLAAQAEKLANQAREFALNPPSVDKLPSLPGAPKPPSPPIDEPLEHIEKGAKELKKVFRL